jgi:4-amino-4-deoxy-L-arabinose transferase-like glycosyltransferase
MAQLRRDGFSVGPTLYSVWSDRLWMVGLGVMALVLITWQMGAVPLRDWDESLVAQVAKEIQRSGFQTWLFPTLNGQPYLNKPPLMHNLVAIAYQLGGVNESMARLPGALLTSASAPLLYAVGRELLGSPRAAGLAGLIYLTSLPVIRHGRMAMLDGVLLTEFLGLLLCLLKARRDLRFGLGVGFGFGLMGLTKGAMALVLGGIALAFTLLDTPRLLASGYLWLGFGLGSAPLGAWYGAQFARYGLEFWQVHVMGQSFGRLWTGVEKNTGSPFYYLFELLKYSAPWLFFLPQGLGLAWRNRMLSGPKLLLLWFVGYLGLISAMGTKLPWYALPLYPAIALLVAPVLAPFWRAGSWWGVEWDKPQRYPLSWLLCFILTAIALVGFVGYGLWSRQDLGLIGLSAWLAVSLAVAAVLVWRRNGQFITVLVWGLGLSLLVLVSTPLWLWELGEAYPVQPIARLLKQSTPPQEVVFTNYPYNRPSLNFYSDRTVRPRDLSLAPHREPRRRDYWLVDAAGLHNLQAQGLPLNVLDSSADWTVVRVLALPAKAPRS